MRMRDEFALVLLALVASSTQAQTLERAFVRAEPLQYSTKEGQFRGCGVNIKVLEEGTAGTRDYLTVSVNVWLDNPSYALVKTAYKRLTLSTGAVVPAGLERSWTRIRGQDPLPQNGVAPGDERSILTWARLDAAMDLVASVMAGKDELQVGFYASGSKLERIFYGTPQWDAGATEAVQSCFAELSDRVGKAQP